MILRFIIGIKAESAALQWISLMDVISRVGFAYIWTADSTAFSQSAVNSDMSFFWIRKHFKVSVWRINGRYCLSVYFFFLLLSSIIDEHCFWAEYRKCKLYKIVPVSLFNLRGPYILMRELFKDPEPDTGCCFRFYFLEITCHLRSWLRWCHLHLNSVRGIQESCHHT